MINFRSEGRRFGNGRCLKAPKSKWRFTKTGEDWFCFAGLWRPAVGDAITGGIDELRLDERGKNPASSCRVTA